MFDIVILLTGAAERDVLPSALLGHHPQLTVIPVETSAELASLHPDLLRRARLVAFVTPDCPHGLQLRPATMAALEPDLG
jgi:methionyl-tRNA formyltransferase